MSSELTTTIHEIFETNSSFHVKWYNTGNLILILILISVFQEFFASIDKIFILAGRLGTELWFCGI